MDNCAATRISAPATTIPSTARFYTDISLLTARPELTEAVQRVFRYLTAEWEAGPEAYRPLMVAPVTLANDFLALIARETEHAKAGVPARIIAKMNALVDLKTIDALYAASQAGVEIDLIVRGMCTLRPGHPGSQRSHPRALHRRPLPGAQPHLLVPERRLAGDLLRQRRLDAAQPLRALRGRLPCR